MRGEMRQLLLMLVATEVLGQNNYDRDNDRGRRDTQITGEMVKKWANTFGVEMWKSLGQATRRETIMKEYDDNPALTVEEIDGNKMVQSMAAEIQTMMKDKIDATKRIVELAENMAMDWPYQKDLGEVLEDGR